jgi:predicted methyltransferase
MTPETRAVRLTQWLVDEIQVALVCGTAAIDLKAKRPPDEWLALQDLVENFNVTLTDSLRKGNSYWFVKDIAVVHQTQVGRIYHGEDMIWPLQECKEDWGLLKRLKCSRPFLECSSLGLLSLRNIAKN